MLHSITCDTETLSVERLVEHMGLSEGTTAQTQALLELVAEGDEQAYDRLLASAAERLFKIIRRMLQSYPRLRRWEQSDDVFQNAAMRLQRSLRKARPDSVRSFYGLASVEIRRTLIDLCRHHFGAQRAAGKYQSDPQGHPGGGLLLNTPDRQGDAESLQAWSRFHEAVEELPHEEREIMHLVWYGGMTQAEVASALGVSLPTVKRRWYRARIGLNTLLGGLAPPGTEPK